MIAHRGVIVDRDAILRCIDQPQIVAFDVPAFQILADQERLQQVRRPGIGGDHRIALRPVKHERLVQTCLDPVKRRPIGLRQCRSPGRHPRPQFGQRIAFELPAPRRQPRLRHRLRRRIKRLAQVDGHCLQIEEPQVRRRRRARRAFSHRQDCRIGGNAAEHLRIAEIDHGFDIGGIREKAAQGRAGPRLEKGGGGNIAKPPTRLQPAHRQFEEIGVKIGAVRRDGVMRFQIRLDRLQQLHPDVRRVADDHVEPTRSGNLGKGRIPVKAARVDHRIGDNRISDADIVIERRQGLAWLGGLQP